MTVTANHRASSLALIWGLPRRLLVAMRSAPRMAVTLLPIAAWIVVSISLGLLLGLAAVILPPTGTFGIVAIPAIVLLWAMPDLAIVPARAVRITFLVMFAVSLTVPAYYTLIVPGLPWVSARRITTFAMIVPFALTMAGSSVERRNLTQVFLGSKILSLCCLGFLAVLIVATITSPNLATSSSIMADYLLTWYVPLFAVIFVVKTEADILLLLKIIIFSAIFVAIISIYDFLFLRQFFFNILPRSLLSMIVEANPMLAGMVDQISFRNGMPRVASLFVTPLSLGEFQAMVAPLTYYFLVHGKSVRERILGLFTAILCVVAIFASGSRGGYTCLIAATVAFVALWLLRKMRFNRYSLVPAIGGMVALIVFGALIALIFLWTRLHNMVLGGGAEASSNVARDIQWAMGIPKIVGRPLIGYGLGSSGWVVGYMSRSGEPTIDSFALAMLVETGIPGFVFYFGMIIVGIWCGVREYLTNPTRSGAIAGSLACSLIAYGVYRLYLSQRENQLLFFVIVGMLIWLMNARSRSLAQQEAQAPAIPIGAGARRSRAAREPTPAV
jgi:O-antigen ligase